MTKADEEKKVADSSDTSAPPPNKVAKTEMSPDNGPLGLRGFSHISINVPDIEKAIEFYTRVFGFMKTKGGEKWGDFDFRDMESESFAKNAGFMNGQCKVDCVWMSHPHLMLNLELMRFHVDDIKSHLGEPTRPQDVGGIKHLSYVVDDITVAFEFLKNQPDIKFISDDPEYKPLQLEPFPFKFFYFVDPFGVQWEIESYGDKIVSHNTPSILRTMDAFIEFKG
jgi:catechol 2,3-dioxygenase-like lactoylglutathione lyase family enzyme